MLRIKHLCPLLASLLLTACGGGSGGSSPTETPDANQSPNAQSDTASTTDNAPVTIDVLANDSDANGDALTVTEVNQAPEHGTATIDNNQIIYTPVEGYAGTDSFSYSVSDGTLTTTANVNISNTQSLTIQGKLLSDVFVSPQVSLVSSDMAHNATPDSDGNYQLNIAINSLSQRLTLTASDIDTENPTAIELAILLGSGDELLGNMDEQRVLKHSTKTPTNISPRSTAEMILTPLNTEVNKTIPSQLLYQTTQFLTLIISNEDYPVPEGSTLLSMFDGENSAQETMQHYFANLELTDENGELSSQVKNDLAALDDQVIAQLELAFSKEMLVGKRMLAFKDIQKGYLPFDTEYAVYFDSDSSLTFEESTYINRLRNEESSTWSIANGQLILPDINESGLQYITIYTVAATWGNDVATGLDIRDHAGANVWSQRHNITRNVTDRKTVILGAAKGYYNIVRTETVTEILDLSLVPEWTLENPTVTNHNIYFETLRYDFSSAMLETPISSLDGTWVLPHEHILSSSYELTHPNYIRAEENLSSEPFNITGETATGAYSGKVYDVTLNNGVINLTDENVSYKIIPFNKKAGGYGAYFEKAKDGDVVFHDYVRIGDVSAPESLTENLTTALPSCHNASVTEQEFMSWDSDKLQLDQVFCHRFAADGTFTFGIAGDEDNIDGSLFLDGSHWSSWEQKDRNIEMFNNAPTDNRHRTWLILGTSEEGITSMFEFEVRSLDFNSDGNLADEKFLHIYPRISQTRMVDLSDYADAWENSLYLH